MGTVLDFYQSLGQDTAEGRLRYPEKVLRGTREPCSSQVTAVMSGRWANKPPPALVCADRVKQSLFGAETCGRGHGGGAG